MSELARHSGYVRLLAIDFSKAFDKASHFHILLSLEKEFGCSTQCLSMIRSFLTERFQRVTDSENLASDWIPISSGVPQGSIMGPILFAILLNSIPTKFSNSKLICYADDTTLLHSVAPGEPDHLQAEINNFLDWSLSKKMEINVKKTKLLTITRNKLYAPSNVFTMNGIPVEEVLQLKLLGIIFQQNTSWNSHFQLIYQKACRGLSVVRKLWMDGFNSKALWSSFYAFVASHIFYAFPALCDLPHNCLKQFAKLETVLCRWSSVQPDSTILTKLDQMCIKLILKVEKTDGHPLMEFFIRRGDSGHSLRKRRTLNILSSSSKAFYLKTFVKYQKFT
jgi:hypothetical protein